MEVRRARRKTVTQEPVRLLAFCLPVCGVRAEMFPRMNTIICVKHLYVTIELQTKLVVLILAKISVQLTVS